MRDVDDFARLDPDRVQRSGVPEMVLAEGKEPDHLQAIVQDLVDAGDRAIVTRLDPERRDVLSPVDDRDDVEVAWHEDALVYVATPAEADEPDRGGRVAVVAAGTADWDVAREAEVVADALGCDVRTAHDVGVAGIHRLNPELEWLRERDCVVVAAGREGALAPVVAGLVDAPVIGLPVGTGYGVGGEGRSALTSMLQSCSPMTVVNVDAGAVAGACAARIAGRVAAARDGTASGQDDAGSTEADPTEARTQHG
jgi:NCAIR mutase (PurE)-related protein